MTDAPRRLITRDELTDAQFDAMMQRGYDQAMAGQGIPVKEAFEKIRARLVESE